MRINQYLASAGLCSRREADRWIGQGFIRINGEVAEIGARVGEGDRVTCRGEEVRPATGITLLALHKPRGIVCTADPQEKDNVIDLVRYPTRLTYLGRLDKDSEGLLLLTDRGELVDLCMRGSAGHPKEYRAEVDRVVSGEEVRRLSEGIYLPELHVTTRPCTVIKTGPRSLTFILTQGLNRQIRRMCREVGLTVRSLTRVRVLNITLGDLLPGQYRRVEGEELRTFLKEVGWK